jgi:hypothetical protein
VLGTNHFYICHLFLVRWLPYSSKCSNTSWNKHFPIPSGTMKCPNHVTPRCLLSCPTIWKPSGSILPLSYRLFWWIVYMSRSLFPF